MASPSLSYLPSEMILDIYKSLDDHHTIIALNLTSRKFFEIWRLNTATITKAVLPRVIDCFDLAQELLAVQRRSTGGQRESGETREGVLERSRRLISNASRALKDYSTTGALVPKSDPDLSDAPLILDLRERLAFTQSHYRIWILVELYPRLKAQNLRLQAATLEELRGMAKTFEWLKKGDFVGKAQGSRRATRHIKSIMPQIATLPTPDKNELDRALKQQKKATKNTERQEKLKKLDNLLLRIPPLPEY